MKTNAGLGFLELNVLKRKGLLRYRKRKRQRGPVAYAMTHYVNVEVSRRFALVLPLLMTAAFMPELYLRFNLQER